MAGLRFIVRWGACTGVALGFLAPAAHALLTLDGSRNQIFVFGSVAFGYSSNIFAESSGREDYTTTAQVGAELKRRAGLIAVNALAKVDVSTYREFRDENTVNPNFSLELNQASGRTTGRFAARAYRETRSDSAVNLRTSAWNFPAALDLTHPLGPQLSLRSATTFFHRTYDDAGIRSLDDFHLVDYTDFSEAIDLSRTYTSKLDLLGGYRFRTSRTSEGQRALDHWLNVGATGELLTKLTGTIRLGYQLRETHGPADENFDHFNVLAGLAWPLTRKLTLNLQANRDFNTIATGESVDSTSAAVYAQYAYTRRLDFRTGATVGRNEFLGRQQADRRDTFFNWEASAAYRLTQNIQAGASYTYFRNWSSLEPSDIQSHGFSLDLSARY